MAQGNGVSHSKPLLLHTLQHLRHWYKDEAGERMTTVSGAHHVLMNIQQSVQLLLNRPRDQTVCSESINIQCAKLRSESRIAQDFD